MASEKSSAVSALDATATVAFIVVCVVAVWFMLGSRRVLPLAWGPERPAEPPVPREPVSIAGAPTRGCETAPVVIIEYSEFQCPLCGKFARDRLPALEQQYLNPGKARFVFRHLPLPELHPLALAAAEAAECAHQQGIFWPVHDWLFQHQHNLAATDLQGLGKRFGLDQENFEQCEASATIEESRKAAFSLQIRATPTLFVGTPEDDAGVRVSYRFSGIPPPGALERAVDTLLGAQART